MGIDIYKKIDEGLSKMEDQNYQYELTGQGKNSPWQELNRRLQLEGLNPCLKELSTQEIAKVKQSDITTFQKVISEDCLANDGTALTNDQITNYMWAISQIDSTIQTTAISKTRHTYDLSRIWIYSDGTTENSPFDLVTDIQDIDKIIFCEDSKYNGVPLTNGDGRFSDLIKGILRFIPKSGTGGTIDGTGGTSTGVYTTIITREILTPIYNSGSIISPYACSYDINTGTGTSWLSKTTIDELIYNEYNSGSTNDNWGNNNGTGSTGTGNTNHGNNNLDGGNYNQLNDNKEWECNQFFCIKIEFKIKQYKLLWGGKSTCIKSILENTDKHLKKFSGTSMIQSKMTKNNFELWLLDVSLPDLLHLWVQVFKRPAPILNLEKDGENKNKDNEFTTDNLLFEKYKNLGWDYKRKNDLQEYKRKTEEYKSIMDCWELTNEECTQKVSQAYNKRIAAGFSEKKNSYTSRAITERANYQDANDSFKEFTELEKFWDALKDFVFNATGIIRKLNEIPQNN